MGDAATARREARRKRILENSHNRLQLISGKSSGDSSNGVDVPEEEDSFIPNSHSHSWTCPNNGSIAAVLESLDSLSSVYHQNTSADDEVSGTLEPPTPAVKELQSSLLEKIVVYNYDVVLLSLLIQLFQIVLSTVERSYFFLPIVMYSVTKLLWFPQDSDSSIASALRLMNHVSSSRVQKLIKITQFSGALFSDICVFLFATVCIQYMYIVIKGSLFT